MPRQASAIEINRFITGLVTDANPLTFPDNASLEEENFVLNIDGSRRRRLGMDFEDGFEEIETTIADAATTEPAFSSYKWDNAGGDAEKSILVVQIGTEVKFFDLATNPISENLIYTYNVSGADGQQTFSYANVDGILVIVTGQKQPIGFEFTAPSTITPSLQTLQIRDLFGVEDVISTDLFENVTIRPGSKTDAHIYNLRNMTWAIPRVQSSTEVVGDPISHFFSSSSSKYPSLSDSVIEALYADPADTDNRTVERFFAGDLVKNPIGTNLAPMGYFIIDALERGVSRLAVEAANRGQYPDLGHAITSLPTDSTPGGAICVSEFAGRVFYSGFSGEIVDGDKNSPRMSSYVLFSQLVRNVADITKCYQAGDPTSKTEPDIVATDGGFIRINEAYGILALKNVGTSLLVCAKNGVWRIYGGSDYGFDATNYLVERITDHGIVSIDSLVVVDNTIMFWGTDGIYHIHTNEFGAWVADNISYGRIQRLYEMIPIEDKRYTKGSYDTYERKVRWLYYNRIGSDVETKELVLDVNLSAYYLNSIKQFEGSNIPRVIAPFTINPYQVVLNTMDVYVDDEPVLVDDEPVVILTDAVLGSGVREVAYVVVTELEPVVKYTFAIYRDPNWKDWKSHDNIGVDASAFVVTGWSGGSGEDENKDYMRHKQVPYLFVHCNRTENGFVEDANGDLTPLNPSSCIVEARWEWSDSANSKRWGRPFQAYRYKRFYMPLDVNDPFDTGFATVVTKNRLRGYGKVLSLKFSTEPDHDLHLYGWSMVGSVATNV